MTGTYSQIRIFDQVVSNISFFMHRAKRESLASLEVLALKLTIIIRDDSFSASASCTKWIKWILTSIKMDIPFFSSIWAQGSSDTDWSSSEQSILLSAASHVKCGGMCLPAPLFADYYHNWEKMWWSQRKSAIVSR